MIIGYLYVALLTALTVLSIKTLVVLKGAAPFTSAGWAFTILYDCTATAEIATRTHAPFAIAYVFLAALIVAFVIAGIRDEPQADPWWWPRTLGLTRAERRIAADPL
jgi:hypothetical protein